MTTATIIQLANTIAEATAKVQHYITSNNLPELSFDPHAPINFTLPPESKEIEECRQAVIGATTKLRTLMLGPTDYLLSHTPDDLLSLHAIYRFQLARSFPIDSEASFQAIAQSCKLSESDTKAFLRHAMTKSIFRESRPGIVAHTALSRLLAEDSQLHDWVGSMTEDMWPANTRTVEAMVKYPDSQEAGQTGFSLANNTEKSIYEVLGQDQSRAQRFGNAMQIYNEGTGHSLQYLTDSFDWEEIGEGTVVDVGGSLGHASIHLAQHFPLLNFVVQDLPSTVGSASKQVPPELAKRIQFMPHDFTKEQPVKGANVYLFRWTLHNWSNKYAVGILKNLVPALKPGARVLINDFVLPEPGTLPVWMEERVRSQDLIMKVIQNSGERELEDWIRLAEEADQRFKHKGSQKPKGSYFSVIEFIWEP